MVPRLTTLNAALVAAVVLLGGVVRPDGGPHPERPLAASNHLAERAAAVPGLYSGFTAGQNNSESRTFIEVQADVTVPAANGCFDSLNNQVMFVWIGLGGTYANSDLLQEGIECNDNGPAANGAGAGTNLPDTGGFHPFYEFADTQYPRRLCGSTTALPPHTTVYEQLSYHPSNDTAHFFMEDLSDGAVFANCSVTAPTSRGWAFDGNTADYIVEAYTTEALSNRIARFTTVRFSDARVERDATRTWAPFGRLPTTERYAGQSRSNYCAVPSAIGRDADSFSVRYSHGDCAIP